MYVDKLLFVRMFVLFGMQDTTLFTPPHGWAGGGVSSLASAVGCCYSIVLFFFVTL